MAKVFYEIEEWLELLLLAAATVVGVLSMFNVNVLKWLTG